MRVWILNPYNPIPGEHWRPGRSALIAAELARRGHQVVWWASGFSHRLKHVRSREWQDQAVSKGFIVRLVPTLSYSCNIGIGRLASELVYAFRVLLRGLREGAPTCIICTDSVQCVGLVGAILTWRHKAKLVLDVQDLWPELFASAMLPSLRPLALRILWPLFFARRVYRRRADGITALSTTYLESALADVPRLASVPHAVVYNGSPAGRGNSAQPLHQNVTDLPDGLMPKRNGELWGIYAGNLGGTYDVICIVHAARRVLERCPTLRLRILVAGDGPLRQRLVSTISGLGASNVHYLGVLPHDELLELFTFCDFGLVTYSGDSNVEMPDKGYDYLASGLPVISSLQGEFGNIVRRFGLGVEYCPGDPCSLADAISTICFDDERRRRMSHNARRTAEFFDRDAQYARLAHLIEVLCGGNVDNSEAAQ